MQNEYFDLDSNAIIGLYRLYKRVSQGSSPKEQKCSEVLLKIMTKEVDEGHPKRIFFDIPQQVSNELLSGLKYGHSGEIFNFLRSLEINTSGSTTEENKKSNLLFRDFQSLSRLFSNRPPIFEIEDKSDMSDVVIMSQSGTRNRRLITFNKCHFIGKDKSIQKEIEYRCAARGYNAGPISPYDFIAQYYPEYEEELKIEPSIKLTDTHIRKSSRRIQSRSFYPLDPTRFKTFSPKPNSPIVDLPFFNDHTSPRLERERQITEDYYDYYNETNNGLNQEDGGQ